MLKIPSFMDIELSALKILLITPPMTQLNTPYPATAYLTGFLRSRGFETVQADPAIELVLKLFSREGLTQIHDELVFKKTALKSFRPAKPEAYSPVDFFLENFDQYLTVVEPALRFLQGKDPSLALRIVSREYLPEGASFQAIQDGADPNETYAESDALGWAFGTLGIQDRAKYLSSLFVDDLADIIRYGIDPRFELSRYADKLAASAPSFDPLYRALNEEFTLVDQFLASITDALITKHQPTLVGITAPFPGNVYGAFRIAQRIKSQFPHIKIMMGGGYVNTELRQLREPRVFEFFDFITLDDGERPLLSLISFLQGKKARHELCRTFLLDPVSLQVVLEDNPRKGPDTHDIPQKDTGIPTYDGLDLSQYLSIFEMLNPMHRIWSDGRWNKLTLAHGCYWKKCNFCDVTLDYIGRYEPSSIDLLIARIESMIQETGQRGFHFVDEAAPPAVLKALAERLIQKGITITWWGNVRFDKTFTPELTRLLARSGCVAVSGGLEVASDRLLKLMQKGVTVPQVARVTRAFADAGIMVHAYLMYGFPTQTQQETVDALELVRQLFMAGCIQSAYWHQFLATAHSPIGKNPEAFGIRILPEPDVSFARNDLEFEDPTGCDHVELGVGLKKALYNYMHGAGLDLDVRIWFGEEGQLVRSKKAKKYSIPSTQIPAEYIEQALAQNITPGLRRSSIRSASHGEMSG